MINLPVTKHVILFELVSLADVLGNSTHQHLVNVSVVYVRMKLKALSFITLTERTVETMPEIKTSVCCPPPTKRSTGGRQRDLAVGHAVDPSSGSGT